MRANWLALALSTTIILPLDNEGTLWVPAQPQPVEVEPYTDPYTPPVVDWSLPVPDQPVDTGTIIMPDGNGGLLIFGPEGN